MHPKVSHVLCCNYLSTLDQIETRRHLKMPMVERQATSRQNSELAAPSLISSFEQQPTVVYVTLSIYLPFGTHLRAHPR